MRPQHGYLLFALLHFVVVAAMFGYTWLRGHNYERSITCTIIWSVLSASLWIVMMRKDKGVAMIGFAVAVSVTAVGCQMAYSLGLPTTAPHCMFAVLLVGGVTAGACWDAKEIK